MEILEFIGGILKRSEIKNLTNFQSILKINKRIFFLLITCYLCSPIGNVERLIFFIF